jgi:inorganic pyrophosphatase
LLKLPTFVDEHTVNFVVESPRGSTSKLKYDAQRHLIALSRS